MQPDRLWIATDPNGILSVSKKKVATSKDYFGLSQSFCQWNPTQVRHGINNPEYTPAKEEENRRNGNLNAIIKLTMIDFDYFAKGLA